MVEFGFLLVVMILIMGGYWSFFVYPRQREFTKRQEYVRSLAQGDEVITFGGIIGRVIDIDGESGVVHLEIADGLIVRVIAASVVSEYDRDEISRNAQQGLSQFET